MATKSPPQSQPKPPGAAPDAEMVGGDLDAQIDALLKQTSDAGPQTPPREDAAPSDPAARGEAGDISSDALAAQIQQLLDDEATEVAHPAPLPPPAAAPGAAKAAVAVADAALADLDAHLADEADAAVAGDYDTVHDVTTDEAAATATRANAPTAAELTAASRIDPEPATAEFNEGPSPAVAAAVRDDTAQAGEHAQEPSAPPREPATEPLAAVPGDAVAAKSDAIASAASNHAAEGEIAEAENRDLERKHPDDDPDMIEGDFEPPPLDEPAAAPDVTAQVTAAGASAADVADELDSQPESVKRVAKPAAPARRRRLDDDESAASAASAPRPRFAAINRATAPARRAFAAVNGPAIAMSPQNRQIVGLAAIITLFFGATLFAYNIKWPPKPVEDILVPAAAPAAAGENEGGAKKAAEKKSSGEGHGSSKSKAKAKSGGEE